MNSNPRYRIVHFAPSLAAEARLPIGALVDASGSGAWRFARAEHVPSAACLGGPRVSAVLQLVLRELERLKEMESLPLSVGPQVSLDDGLAVPFGVLDPAAWVQAFILPRRPGAATQQGVRVSSMGTVGLRFFEHHNVRQYVRRKFDPGSVEAQRKAIPPITHYVRGLSELLLMEPVVGTRNDVETVLQKVNGGFLAWQKLFDNHHVAEDRTFIAYVFGGDRVTELARARLRESRARVVNVENLPQRVEFVRDIRRVGESAATQGSLLQ